MHPSLRAEKSSIKWYNPSFHQTLNTNFINDGVEAKHFIRGHRIPKISPLLPNPDYLSAFSHRSNRSNNYLYHTNSIPMQTIYPQMKERFILPKSYQRKQQVDNIISCQLPKTCGTADDPSSAEVSFEDTTLNSTKNNLLQSIIKVDIEIKEVEYEIAKYKKKQQELEESANKPSINKAGNTFYSAHYALFQNIYAENKLKAYNAHNIFTSLSPKVDFPLYNQPSDTLVYLENKEKYAHFKEKLLTFLKKKFTERRKIQKRLLRVYSSLAFKWKNDTMKIENSRRYKKAEAKKREYFEKFFPDLNKKKYSKGSNRISDRVRSEADFQEILDKLQLENLENKIIKSCAVVPPLLLDAEQRKLRNMFYVNKINQIKDVVAEKKANELLNIWTPAEKKIFKEKFIQYSKNFGVIASYLKNKSISDCVKFYYLTKKKRS